jgi:RNA polymerase sigma-70 factor (ECF subfamily)
VGWALIADPSPVVQLNRAVAVAMDAGPGAGLDLVDKILESGDLARYHLAHATRADLLRQLRRTDEARAAYEQALKLVGQKPKRRFIRHRIEELGSRRCPGST